MRAKTFLYFLISIYLLCKSLSDFFLHLRASALLNNTRLFPFIAILVLFFFVPSPSYRIWNSLLTPLILLSRSGRRNWAGQKWLMQSLLFVLWNLKCPWKQQKCTKKMQKILKFEWNWKKKKFALMCSNICTCQSLINNLIRRDKSKLIELQQILTKHSLQLLPTIN